MAADFSASGSAEVLSKELENQARVQAGIGRLLLFMMAHGITQPLIKKVVDQIETTRNDERGGVGRPVITGFTARSSHAVQEGPGHPFSQKCIQCATCV